MRYERTPSWFGVFVRVEKGEGRNLQVIRAGQCGFRGGVVKVRILLRVVAQNRCVIERSVRFPDRLDRGGQSVAVEDFFNSSP
jgi:hypothetical protein